MEQVRKETAQPYPRIIYNNAGNDTDGGDTVANAPLGKSAITRLRVRVSSVGSGEDITVRLNGQLPSIAMLDDPPAPDPLGIWLGMGVDPAVVRAGDNLVKLRFDSSRGMDEPPRAPGCNWSSAIVELACVPRRDGFAWPPAM